MSRRLNRIGLLLVALLASEVWALGLGDIRLDSALNEPLVAEIELLSATAEEMQNLDVALASAATFERYGLDRPVFLQSLEFEIVRRGNAATVIRVTSPVPITEPFVTFLVEATWPAGRLLREYTVLLDPPTFAPPPSAGSTPAVEAPREPEPADRGRIERPSQPAAPAPSRPAARPAAGPAPGDVATGSDYQVRRGDNAVAHRRTRAAGRERLDEPDDARDLRSESRRVCRQYQCAAGQLGAADTDRRRNFRHQPRRRPERGAAP
ncbi:MAG: hypothetical protein U5K76_07685 [Woeseiaceae bacterium]|nr:hypothetical protein [Woeseiaceae bacterium]